jgi:hypothetical protein
LFFLQVGPLQPARPEGATSIHLVSQPFPLLMHQKQTFEHEKEGIFKLKWCFNRARQGKMRWIWASKLRETYQRDKHP